MKTYPSEVSGWSASTPWKIRLFFLFCSKSYIFSCISSMIWFIVSSLSFILLASVSTSKNLDLYSRLCKLKKRLNFLKKIVIMIYCSLFFTESAPQPIKSIICNICLCLRVCAIAWDQEPCGLENSGQRAY